MTPSKKENLPQLRNRKQFKKFSLNDSRTRAGPSISKEPAEPEIIDLSEAGPSFRPLPKLLTQTNEVICLSSDDEDASSQMSVLDLVKSAVDKSFNSSNSLFYEDKSTIYDQNEVPVYTIASQETLTENSNSVDSKIIVDEVNMVESQPDDSVVFVYEEKLDRRPNSKDSFIPLAQSNHRNRPNGRNKPKAKKSETATSVQAQSAPENPQKASSIQPQSAPGNPQKATSIQTQSAPENPQSTTTVRVKRKVIIDGSNVGFAHGKNSYFSLKGVQLALQHFELLGHSVIAILPKFQVDKVKLTDRDTLDGLIKSGKIVITPARKMRNITVASYDDRFIVEAAKQFDAVVISNDYFRDLANEDEGYRTVVETRVIGFSWIYDKLFLPQDPWGRNGPKLDEVLHKAA